MGEVQGFISKLFACGVFCKCNFSTMMESCLNDKVARAETILVEDLRRDLRYDLTEMAEAQVSSSARLTCAHLLLCALGSSYIPSGGLSWCVCVQDSGSLDREFLQVFLRIRPFSQAELENGEAQVRSKKSSLFTGNYLNSVFLISPNKWDET